MKTSQLICTNTLDKAGISNFRTKQVLASFKNVKKAKNVFEKRKSCGNKGIKVGHCTRSKMAPLSNQ